MLAAVAARYGAPWEGPGTPAEGVEVAEGAPPWEVLDATRETLVDDRSLGAHHTPPDLARRLAALALDGSSGGEGDVVVADPACGGGAFLVAAGEVLAARGADRRRLVEERLVGADVDPLAVATARAALWLWSGGATAAGVEVADGLCWKPGRAGRVDVVDVVVGNPPFRSPLAAGAGRGALAAYTDLAGRFLVAAVELVRPGGTVLLLQPESVLAARDAAPVRAAAPVHGLWVAGEPVFDADVRVCAPLMRPGTVQPRRVRRWRGRRVDPAGSASFDPAAPTWAHLRPGAPGARQRSPSADCGTIGDLATATAGFRDEFYGLAAVVTEGGDGLPLVTSGLIDPGRVAWGERPARIAGRRYLRPTVDPAVLEGRLAAWVEARRRPKVLVATQTRCIEAAPDPEGRYVPMTPVIAVHPHDPADVDRIVDALSDPAATEWAHRHYGGTGLGAGTLRLSASQILDVPLPARRAPEPVMTSALPRAEIPLHSFDTGAGRGVQSTGDGRSRQR